MGGVDDIYQELDRMLQSISRHDSKGERQQDTENCEIEREMRGEIPVLADVTETAEGNVQATDFCGNCGDEEDPDERRKDGQSTEIKTAQDQGKSAEYFQPGQIKRKPDADRPRQNFVIVDVVSELDGVENFDRAGINENSADDKIDDAPDELWNV